jgi:glycosyltransferase involved in cell wall biosynthesis
MNPKVTILLFFKEDRGWLKDAVTSVLNQDYEGEIQLLRSDIHNPHYHKLMNASNNLNYLLPLIEGKYVKYLCEDDELTKGCVRESVKAMEEQGCDVLHGNAINRFTNADGTYKDKKYSPPITTPEVSTMKQGNYVHGGTLFYKASLFKEGYTFDTSLDCAEELDLNLKLLTDGKVFGYCNQDLYIYRRHTKQKSLGSGIDQTARAKRIQAIFNRY